METACAFCGVRFAPRRSQAACPHCGAAAQGPLCEDRCGPYVLTEALGQGGLGQVFRARDEDLGRDAALKVPRLAPAWPAILGQAEYYDALTAAARRAARVSHPFLPSVYQVTALGERPAIVGEFVAGRPLAESLREELLPPGQALYILQQLCRALAAAWAQGKVVHGNLHPGNLLLDSDGLIRVLDLGLATALPPELAAAPDAPAWLPEARFYLAPERLVEPVPPGLAADLFALGMLSYRLLTGANAFAGRDPAELLRSKLSSMIADPRDFVRWMPDSLATLIDAMLAPAPEFRPQGYAEIETALRESARQLGVATAGGLIQPGEAPPRPAAPPPHGDTPPGGLTAAAPAAPPPLVQDQPTLPGLRTEDLVPTLHRLYGPPQGVDTAVPEEPREPDDRASIRKRQVSTLVQKVMRPPVAPTPEGPAGARTITKVIPAPRRATRSGSFGRTRPTIGDLLAGTRNKGRPGTSEPDTATERALAMKPPAPGDDADDRPRPGPAERLAATVIQPGPGHAADETQVFLPQMADLLKQLRLGRRVGDYVIGRILGVGGMGVVCRGMDLARDQAVALKFLAAHAAGDLEHFAREANLVRELKHEAIVRVRDVVSTEGLHFLAMDLVLGPHDKPVNLLNYSQEFGAGNSLLDEADMQQVALLLLDALDYAHLAGVVHCDLKPENILFDCVQKQPDGFWEAVLKLTDFGLARLVGETAVFESVTASIHNFATNGLPPPDAGALIGTYEYMSPEQRRGEFATPRSDLYAVGLILLRLLTGATQLSLRGRPSRLRPGLRPEWDEIILKALREEPGDRFEDAHAMAEAIRALEFED